MAADLPRLIVITDWSVSDLFRKLEQAMLPGVAIQHRHPEATARQFYEEAVRLKALCDRHGTPLFINRRVDVALALNAWLHLPSYGLLPQDVREKVSCISVAVHSAEEAARAEGADLALVSPVFAKGSATPLGVEGFAKLAALLPCPAYALGGVATPVAGAAGHAVISAVLEAADPRAAAAKLLA